MKQTNKCGCQCACGTDSVKSPKTLTITWQRLISDNKTCPRCSSTEDELDKAVQKLKESLSPLGIAIEVKKTEIALEQFKKDPIQSNKILFNGKTLEDLIGGQTGQSRCCDVCGDNECRTLEVNGESHEVITADLIVKAGLRIASEC